MASEFLEDLVSHLPALQVLCNLGYQYLTPAEVNALRDNRKGTVLLKPILDQQLRKLNQIQYKGQTIPFSDANMKKAIDDLDVPLNDGFIKANETVHELLTSGVAPSQTIDGDKRSFSLQYIDWTNPANNVYHVTDEYEVERRGTHQHCIPDIVLFVNGIPLAVIECKRPDLKDAIKEAISQHIRNQGHDYIPHLFNFSQLLISVSQNQAKYATTGTPAKFWAIWRDELEDVEKNAATVDEAVADYQIAGLPVTGRKKPQLVKRSLKDVVNRPLSPGIWKKFEESHTAEVVAKAREIAAAGPRLPSPQDELLFNIARPERLLELTERFIVYETEEGKLLKKICRYQQYFAILETLATVTNVRGDEQREGGVIWHTTGSGKSLTMVMLAKALAMEPTIKNPRVIIVTDRVDLDLQIFKTFKACGKTVAKASSGENLKDLIADGKAEIITTIIDKFESAIKSHGLRDLSRDVFILVDESHRSQSGIAHASMRKGLPNGCFIGFTGTPLLKAEKGRREKKKFKHVTRQQFGDYLHSYSMKKAVEDKAVTPILYEGRMSQLKPDKESIDKWFARITQDLNDVQRADLKQKFSKADELLKTDDRLYEIAFDICNHFCENFKGTKKKGQFAVSNKAVAVRYLQLFDQIGKDFPQRKVSTRLVISSPDMREGNDEVDDPAVQKKVTSEEQKNRIKMIQEFWDQMMQEYRSEAKYLKTIVSDFKTKPDPEILIVVDKLLTGFDAPCNSVLYIDKVLKGHNILQAIARVNRLFEGKDEGLVIDYRGIFGDLNEAMKTYSELDGYEPDEIEGSFTDAREEIAKLPERHTNVWAVFSGVQNKRDMEALQQHLRPEDVRQKVYDALNSFSKTLQLALSNVEFHLQTEERKINLYTADLRFFRNLRQAVKNRYNEAIDYSEYEDQIRNMVNKYVGASEVEQITEPVNIFEVEDIDSELEKVQGEAAKADFIASRVKKTCTEKMDEDSVLYESLSKMIEDAIKAYLEGRISEGQYLERMLKVWNELKSNDSSNLPQTLRGNPDAMAYYRLILKSLQEAEGIDPETDLKSISAHLAERTDEIIERHKVRDWKTKTDVTNAMTNDLENILFDLQKNQLPNLSSEVIDSILELLMRTAVKRER